MSRSTLLQYISLIFLVIVFITLLFSVNESDFIPGHSSSMVENEVPYLIGVSHPNLSEPWRVVMNEEINEEAAKHKEIRVICTDGAHDTNKQINDIHQLMDYGIDLLIVSLNDPKILTPLVSEIYKQIPVIVLDRSVEGYDYTLYIGPDNESIGMQAGKYIVTLLGKNGGNVVEIKGLQGSPPSEERSKGLKKVLNLYKNIQIIDSITADWQRDNAEDVLKKRINGYPPIDVIFAHNDAMALGAYKALKSNHNTKIIGVDGLLGENQGLDLVKTGKLEATFTCPTGGRESIQYALDILNHVNGIPKKIILRNNNIMANNVDDYITSIKEKREEKPKSSDIVLGFAQVGAESTWRIANSRSIQQAAEEEGIQLLFKNVDNDAPTKEKQKQQIENMQWFIEQKVDVIAFSPIIETGWDEILQKAKNAKIPVILSDRKVSSDNSLWTSFMGSDFVEEGRRAANWLVQSLNTRKAVRILELRGNDGAAPALDRSAGFKEVLQKYPNYSIIYSETANFTYEEGKEAMNSLFKYGNKPIDVVYAHNDDMALGAAEAIEDHGLIPGKDIILVSIDATKQAFQAMSTGKLNCSVECNPLLGPQLMKAIKDLMGGKELPIQIITEEGVFPQETAKKVIETRQY